MYPAAEGRRADQARYAVLAEAADPELAAKYNRIASAEANVSGIMDWLDKTPL